MRRNYKFFLSLILSVALLVNTAAPVFATDAGNGNEISEGITDSSSEQDEGNVGNPDVNPDDEMGMNQDKVPGENSDNSDNNGNSEINESNENSGNIEEINYDNQIALTSEGELGSPAGTDIIYVSSTEVSGNDTDTGDGSEANPYSQLYTAIENASSGATIIIKDKIYVNDRSNNSAPLIINKNLTIKGYGDHPKLNTRTGGIILGGDVIFENITLSFANSVRNEIMANGYTLTLDSVRYDSSAQGINLFCGGIVGYSGSEPIPNMGSHGQIIIRNGSSLGDPDPLNLTANIYAGNLIDNIINSDDSTMNIPATITIESMVGDGSGSSKSKFLGTIFAKGAVVSNGLGIDFGGTKVTPPTLYPGKGNITGDVTINLCSEAVKNVYADQGGDKYATVNFSSSDAYLNPDIFLDQAGAINVLSGYFQLAASSSFASNNMPLLIADGARLDVDKMYEASTPVLNVGDFAGGGTIGLNNNQTLHVNGQATGNTKVALTPTSALKGNTYVSFNSPQTGASFEFDSTTNNWQLSYDPAAKSYIAGDGSDITDDNVDYGPTYNGNENFANLVVFVDFAGTTHKHKENATIKGCFATEEGAKLTFNKYFDGDGDHPMAMKRYLDKVSYGTLKVANYFPGFNKASGMFERVKLNHDESYYSDNNFAKESEMITEIANTLNSLNLCDGMKLDLEGNDNVLDNLTIVVPSNENNETMFTGHRSTYGGDQTKIAGKMIGSYNVIHETGIYQGYEESALIIHEFMHSLGYPDLYRTRGMDQSGTPVGRFDIMSSVGRNVQYPLAYLRYSVRGWLPALEEITSSRQSVQLYAPTTAPGRDSKQAVIIKTPYSNSEFFVAEYRKMPAYVSDKEYDYFGASYNSGLIIYRVNLGKDDLYNTHSGGDAIYVFRPGDTRSPSGGEVGSGKIQNAALATASGSYWDSEIKNTFGSANPTDSTEQNAITYSDGHNSGIVIKNVGTASGDTITFDIEMTDIPYDWEILTSGEASEDTKLSDICAGADGTLYVAKSTSTGASLYTFNTANKSYTLISQLQNASASTYVKLAECNGKIYVAYTDSSNKPVLYSLNGGVLSLVYKYSGAGTFSDVSLTSDSGLLGFAFAENSLVNTNGYLYAITSGGSGQLYTINNPLCVTKPEAAVMDGKLAVAYRDKNNKVYVARLDGSSFSNTLIDNIYSNYICLASGEGKTYLFASKDAGALESFSYDKNSGAWQKLGNVSETYCNDMVCNVTNGVPCLMYTTDGITYAKQYKGGAWELIGSEITNTRNNSMSLVSNGDTLYASYLPSFTNKVEIKKYIGNIWDPSNTGTDPDDTTESTVVRISVPSGYEGSLICIDGVNYEGLNESGSTYSADPGNKTSKVAVVYKNDAKGVPRGMYIWTLKYVNGAYVATPQPELADLIVAQGFSVRITGVSGIRFRSAMNTSQREALEGSGLAGFKIKEFGTIYTGTRNIIEGRPLLINQSYTSGDQDPSVKIDDSGNKVKEIVTKENGKDIISFVITNMPADKYKNVYYFRAYANLIKDGEMITVYGPIRSKSLFAVADQLLATNNYKTTSEKNALQKMVNDANNATP